MLKVWSMFLSLEVITFSSMRLVTSFEESEQVGDSDSAMS